MKIFAFLFIASVAYAQEHERWPVKILTDGFIPSKNWQIFTIDELRMFPKVKVGNTTPRLESEKMRIAVEGIVISKRKEADGDWHIEIRDESSDSTIVCEAIDPTDSIAFTSPYIVNFVEASAAADRLKVGNRVKIQGIFFQDKYHSPSKYRIRNFLEIHPILSIE
jgi:hypothetical protein